MQTHLVTYRCSDKKVCFYLRWNLEAGIVRTIDLGPFPTIAVLADVEVVRIADYSNDRFRKVSLCHRKAWQ